MSADHPLCRVKVVRSMSNANAVEPLTVGLISTVAPKYGGPVVMGCYALFALTRWIVSRGARKGRHADTREG